MWDKFVMEEVWGRHGKRKKLQQRLATSWKTADLITVELGQARREVSAIFCNDRHIFCGQDNGIVGVYQSYDGQWERDLVPSEMMWGIKLLAGSVGVLAAVSRDVVLTVWNTSDQMKELHCFKAHNYRCRDVSCDHGADSTIGQMKVIDPGKIAVLVEHHDQNKASLLFLKRIENVWDHDTLACFPLLMGDTLLAADDDLLAVAIEWRMRARRRENVQRRFMLWQENKKTGQEIELPSRGGREVLAIFMELPFLVLILSRDRRTAEVQVYRIGPEDQMKDVSSEATLVKTICINNSETDEEMKLVSNQLFMGVVQQVWGSQDWILNLYEKRFLFNNKPSTEVTGFSRQIHLPRSYPGDSPRVTLTNSSLIIVWGERDEERRGRRKEFLIKKDFWMTNNVL